MKRMFLFCISLLVIQAILCSSAFANNMLIRRGGADWAEIFADGTVMVNKNLAGKIDDDGTVKIAGKVAGKIDLKTGEIVKDGKKFGQLDFDGRVRINDEVVWKIGSTIRKNEIEWGLVTNMVSFNDMLRVAALVIFFGD